MEFNSSIVDLLSLDLSRSTHHISFGRAKLLTFNEVVIKKVESLRTLYQLTYYNTRTSDCLPINHSIRALRIRYFNLSSLESLIHLCYLGLRDLDIETLPDSIYSLGKLEILKLSNCFMLRCLPEHLTCLENHRHAVIEYCVSLSRILTYIGKLYCLRTLSVYIVRTEPGHSLQELHDLKLGAKLSIQGLNNVVSLSEAQEANLLGKKEIQELCLSWNKKGEARTPTTSPEQVLEALQPHSNLKSFQIHMYEGLRFPSWIETNSDLVSLKLDDCKNCVRLPPLGKLPSLKYLRLTEMHNVRYMDDDESVNGAEVRAFSSLEKLKLRGLENIERLLKVERADIHP